MSNQQPSNTTSTSSGIKTELYLEEYKTLQAAYLSYEDAIMNNTNFTLTALGALIALGAFSQLTAFNSVILIAPIVFYTLCWSHLRIVNLQNKVVSYLNDILIPQIYSSLGANQADNIVFGWDNYRQMTLRKQTTILNIPILGPLFILQLGITILLVIIPIYFTVQGSTQLGSIDRFLIILNSVLIFYTGIQGWRVFHDSLQ